MESLQDPRPRHFSGPHEGARFEALSSAPALSMALAPIHHDFIHSNHCNYFSAAMQIGMLIDGLSSAPALSKAPVLSMAPPPPVGPPQGGTMVDKIPRVSPWFPPGLENFVSPGHGTGLGFFALRIPGSSQNPIRGIPAPAWQIPSQDF